MDHAAQLPLPAFCMPGDTFPLSKLVPFKRHPCWVVESAGVVILEEVAAEPAATRRASRRISRSSAPLASGRLLTSNPLFQPFIISLILFLTLTPTLYAPARNLFSRLPAAATEGAAEVTLRALTLTPTLTLTLALTLALTR